MLSASGVHNFQNTEKSMLNLIIAISISKGVGEGLTYDFNILISKGAGYNRIFDILGGGV